MLISQVSSASALLDIAKMPSIERSGLNSCGLLKQCDDLYHPYCIQMFSRKVMIKKIYLTYCAVIVAAFFAREMFLQYSRRDLSLLRWKRNDRKVSFY